MTLRNPPLAALCLALLGGCSGVAPTNPYDPGTPTEKQAAGALSGTLVLPSSDGVPLRLLDATGLPVAGADNAPRLTLARARPGRPDVSDFAFTDLPPGAYRVAPGDDGRFKAFLAPAIPLVKLGPGEKQSLGTLVFTRLDTGTGRVHGQVVLRNAQGGPRELKLYRQVGATLEVRPPSSTDAAGAFDLKELPPGHYALSAEHPGFTPDYRVGFDLADEPGALANEAVFEGDDALKLFPVTAVLVPDVQRSFGKYYTRERTVPVQVLAFGGMTEMRLSTDPAFVDATGADEPFEPFTAAATVALPAAEGPLDLYSQFRQSAKAGFSFTSDVFAAQVVRDATAPEVLRVAARGYVPDAQGRLWVRDGTQPVTFEIEGTDLQSAVAAYAVHHDPLNSPGLVETLVFKEVDAPGGLMRTDETLTLSAGDGPKSVWVYLRDRAGNTSDPREIVLDVDSTPPVVAPLQVTNARPGNVLDELTAQVRLEVDGICGGGTYGRRDDCPVTFRVGAKPLATVGLALPLPMEGFSLEQVDGHEKAVAVLGVPFTGVHGQVISFEGYFTDAAGNLAHVESPNYTLHLTGSMKGRVLVEGFADDQPRHGGILVRLYRMGVDPGPDSLVASGLTAPDGRFELADVAAGRYLVALSRSGAVSQQASTEVRAKEVADLGTVRLATARGLLTGRFVRSDLRDQPVGHAGIAVTVRLEGTPVLQLTTADDGTFLTPAPGLPVSAAGQAYTVTGDAQGYVSRAVDGVTVAENTTFVMNPDPAAPTVPVPYELARLTGDFDLCEATGPCTPVLFSNRAQKRVKLRSTANVTKIRVRARTPFAAADPTPFAAYADGDLTPVDLAGADGSVDVYVQVMVDTTPVSLHSHVTLDTVAPTITAFTLDRGTGAMLDGFTREKVARALVSASAGTGLDIAPLEQAHVVFAAAAPSAYPAGATGCAFDARCTVPLDRNIAGTVAEGLHPAFAFACDAAGNCTPTPTSATIVYDETAPRTSNGVSFTPTSSSIRTAHGRTYTRTNLYDVTLALGTAKTAAGAPVAGTDGRPVAEVLAYHFGTRQPDNTVRYGPWSVLSPAPDPGAVNAVPGPSLPAVDDDYRYYLQLRDAAGNETDGDASTLSYGITLDSTPPAVTFNLDDGAAYTRYAAGHVSLGIAFAAGDRGPAEQVVVARDGGLFQTVQTFALPLASTDYDLKPAPAPQGDGTYSVYARFIDAAGNQSDRFAHIFLDRTSPEILSARCGSCTTDATGALFASRPELTLYVTAADNSGKVDLVRTTIDAGTPLTQPHVGTLALILPDVDGAHAVKLEVLDPAGNVSTATTLSVKLDRTAPAFTVRLGDGSATTATATLAVSVTTSDATDFATMEVANVSTFSGAARTAFTGSFTWTLAAPTTDGSKDVFVRITDLAGNQRTQSASVTLRTLSTVSGTVKADGAAAGGVLVALAGTVPSTQATFTQNAITDAAGKYAFAAVPAATYALTFTRTGYEVTTLAAVVVAPGTDVDVAATLRRALGGLSGRVVAAQGTTGLSIATDDAAGVAVVVSDPSLATTYSAATDAAGHYAIGNIPVALAASATYTVTATKRGFSPTTGTATVVAGTAAPVADLTLAAAGRTVSGCVAVPAPAPDASGVTATLDGVAFNGAGYARAAAGPTTVAGCAGGGGAYAFANVPDGSYTVTLARSGYQNATVKVTVAGAAATAPTATLVRATGGVSGKVVTSAGVTGLSPASDDATGIAVVLTDATLASTYSAVTDNAGAYTIPAVPVPLTPGASYTITATKKGFTSATTSATITAGAIATAAGVTLATAGFAVDGCVAVPAPAPDASGVTVSLAGVAFNGNGYGKPAAGPTTVGGCPSGGGAYTFANVPNGTYTITLARAGFLSAAVQVNVAGGNVTAPPATFGRATGGFSGRVFASAGVTGLSPASDDATNVAVIVSDPSLGTTFAGVTDAAGNYTIAGIPVPLTGGATYTVTATKKGFSSPTTTASASVGTTTPVADLTLAAAGRALTGCVAVPAPAPDASGVAAALAGVAFNGTPYARNAAGPTTVGTCAGGGGAYAFANVPDGTYTVTLTRAGFLAAAVSVTVLGGGATAPLATLGRATGSYSGRVVASAGLTGLSPASDDAANVAVVVSDPALASTYAAVTDAAGNYALAGIPVPLVGGANYTLTATKRGFASTSTSASVSSGATTSVADLTLAAAGRGVSGCVGVPAPAPDASGVAAALSGVAFNGTPYARNATGPTTVGPCANGGGAYAFASVPDGNYTLTLTLPGYQQATTPVTVSGGSATASAVTLARASGAVAGTVLGNDGQTGLTPDLAGALVQLTGADLLGGLYQATTDASGTWSIQAVPVSPTGASYTVTVSKSNYTASGTTTAVVAAAGSVTAAPVTLTVASGTVGGTVTVPNPPVANSAGIAASLVGTAFNGASVSRNADAPSSAGGAYQFTRMPPGTYTLQLSRAGFQTLAVSGVAVTASTTTTVSPRTLLRATGGLYGRIVLNANGTSLTLGAADLLGASVVVTGSGLVGTYAANTDASGNWSLTTIPVGVPAGTYTITGTKPGYASAGTTATVVADTSSPVTDLTMNVVTYTLSGLATVEGGVNNAGVSAALTGVAFNGAAYSANTGPTPASGAFSFTNLPAGTYAVTLTGNASYTPLSLAAATIAPAPAQVPTLAGTVRRGTGTVSGRVVPAAGGTGVTLSSADAAGVAVVLTDASLPSSYGAVTDAAGNFTITGIPAPLTPGQTYALTATKPGFQDGTGTATVASGSPATAADIGLNARGSSLTGQVSVSSPATSASGVQVTLSGTAFNGTSFQATAGNSVAGAVDAYTFASLPNSSGRYLVTATAAGFAPVTAALPVTGSPVSGVNLTLLTRATATITGTVNVTAGTTGLAIGGPERSGAIVVVSGADLTFPMRTQTDSTGAFVLQNVPVNVTGSYSVTVSKANYTASPGATVSLTDGGTSNVTGLALTVAAGSLPMVVELHDFVNQGDYATYGTVSVTLTGTAFTGTAVSPVTQSTSAADGTASFANLPAGNYTVAATLAQHGPNLDRPASANGALAAGITVPAGGAASTTTLRLYDTAAPSAPIVTIARRSPTSSSTTALNLVAASVDPTLPTANLRDYQVYVCSRGTVGCSGPITWTGGADLFTLTGGVDNSVIVLARDWNGNTSSSVTLGPIRRESRIPTQPANVHIDNRPGAVRVSWDPVAPPGSLPVAGYKVYYGPMLGYVAADFGGDFAAQGPSPIDVGAHTELLLNGLPNGSVFYLSVTAYDGVVDPSPNESALSAALAVNPNVVPLDRAVRATVDGNANTMALMRDTLFVSSGAAAPFSIKAYRYDSYGALTPVGATTNPYARNIVADPNRTLYAFDPAGDGIAILDAATPSAISVVYGHELPGKRIDHFVPSHRGGLAPNGSMHHVFTYMDVATGQYRVETESVYATNHLDIGGSGDGNFLPLQTQTAPREVQVVGNHVFTYHVGAGNSLDAYTIANDFSSIVARSKMPIPGGSAGTMVVDWPYVYASSGNAIYVSTLTSQTTPIIVGPPAQAATIEYAAKKMRVVGSLLLVAEDTAYGITAIEAFSLADPLHPVFAGTYTLNATQEVGGGETSLDFAINGPDLFLLSKSSSNQGLVDVVELGNPRSIQRLTSVFPDGLPGLAAAVRGSRLLAFVGGPSFTELVSADLHNELANFATAAPPPFTSSAHTLAAALSHTSHPTANPMTVWGDYAFVAAGADGNQIQIYDVATPVGLAGAVPLATVTPTVPPNAGGHSWTALVTGLAASHDYLLASVNYLDNGSLPSVLPSPATYLQRWDLSKIYAPTGPVMVGTPTKDEGRGLDVSGRFAYVGVRDGFCRVDYIWMTEMGCFSVGTGIGSTMVNGLHVSAGKIHVTYTLSGVSNTGVAVYALGDETQPPTVVSDLAYGASPAVYAIPLDIRRFGPMLFTVQSVSSQFKGLVAYDATTPLLPATGFAQLANPSTASFAVAGPYVVLPSVTVGTTLYRMY